MREPTRRSTGARHIAAGARHAAVGARPTAARARRIAAVVAAVALAVVTAGCLPIPDVRRPLELRPPPLRMRPATVSSDYVSVPGVDEPHTPDALDRSYLLRFRAHEPTTAVLVLVPGIFGGASSLEVLARQLVASTPGLQVWCVDRRSNALEDHRGFDIARRARDVGPALDYYFGRDGVPATFQPPADADIAYMAWWGLSVHLGDLEKIVEAAHAVAPTVYLGGHSLGASIVALYAAFLLPDGTTGADTIDGLMLLDGVPGRTGAFDERDLASGRRILGVQVLPSIEDLEAGRARAYLSYNIAPWYMIRQETIAYAADLQPLELAPGRLSDYHITNFALAGVSFDATYALAPLFAPSLGEARDARFAGNLPAFLIDGTDALASRTVVGVAVGAERVSWGPGDPPAPTALSDFVGTWVDPHTDRAEWYFPTRLLIDLARLPVGLSGAPGFVPNEEVRVPTLAVGAGRGLVRDLGGFATYANARLGSAFSAYIVPGLTHIDLITARTAPVATLFDRWRAALER